MASTLNCTNFFEELTQVCNDKQRKYELDLTHLVEQNDPIKLKDQLIAILEADNEGSNVAYAAFYTLTILYRRNKDITLLEGLINQYGNRFKDTYDTYTHLYVLYLKEKGVGKDVFKIINKAYEASSKLQDNAGVVHNFVETVVAAYEDSDNTVQTNIKKEWLDKAKEAIEKAISLDNQYAKYYCTKGRLLAIEEEFDEAKDNLKKAIDIEDSTKNDYVIRLGNYQYYLSYVQSSQHLKNMESQFCEHKEILQKTMADLEDSIKESNIKNLEFLGFFAAIVSFTIGSVQIINNQQINDAIVLIITLFTCLIAVFSAFGIILHGLNKKTLINSVIFILSLIGIFFIMNYS